jgi:hypothetical protein
LKDHVLNAWWPTGFQPARPGQGSRLVSPQSHTSPRRWQCSGLEDHGSRLAPFATATRNDRPDLWKSGFRHPAERYPYRPSPPTCALIDAPVPLRPALPHCNHVKSVHSIREKRKCPAADPSTPKPRNPTRRRPGKNSHLQRGMPPLDPPFVGSASSRPRAPFTRYAGIFCGLRPLWQKTSALSAGRPHSRPPLKRIDERSHHAL